MPACDTTDRAAILIRPILRGPRCHENPFAFLSAHQDRSRASHHNSHKWFAESMAPCSSSVFSFAAIRTPLSFSPCSGFVLVGGDQDGDALLNGRSLARIGLHKQGHCRTFNRVRNPGFGACDDIICHPLEFAAVVMAWRSVPALGLCQMA